MTKKVGLGACSAVYISPNEALTAAHCVADTTGNMWVRNSHNKAFRAHIIKKDKKNDLCLLLIEGPSHPYVKLGPPARIGDKIYVMGNDDRMPFTYGEGHVKNVLIDNDTNILTLVYAVTSLPGSSGSGVFDDKGRLVGIHTMGYKSVAYATDVTIVEGFLGLRGSKRH